MGPSDGWRNVGLTPIQRESAEWLKRTRRGMLVAGMGSGKTRTALTALAELGPEALPALILAPAQVAESTWSRDAAEAGVSLLVEECPRGRPAARARVLEGPADVRVLSVASASAAAGGPWRTVVVDECTLLANPGTKREKTVRALTRDPALRLWMLTGTPGHDPIRLWTLARLLDGGKRLGRSVTQARDAYLTDGVVLPSGARVGREPRPGAVRRVTEAMADMVRVAPADDRLSLPDLDVRRVPVRMGPLASAMSLGLMQGEGVTQAPGGWDVVPSSAGARAMLLHQLTTGAAWTPDLTRDLHPDAPDLLVPDRTRPTIDAAVRLAADLRGRTGRGVLIEHWFIHEREALLPALVGAGLRVGRADSAPDRAAWGRGEVDALVAHPASTGHGLNLQHGGESMVWTTPPWSLELWEQASARLARPGQTAGTVTSHVLVPTLGDGSPTVAARILDTLEARGDVQHSVLEWLDGGATCGV